MDFVLLAIAALFVASFRLQPKADQLDRHTTATINGFFLLLVMFSHFMTYVSGAAGPLTRVWMATKGELIVTTFLWFSGYGVMTQIMRRGHGYVDHFPTRRILFVWLKFAAAITLFLLVAVGQHRPLTAGRIGLAYLGLATLGNSGWYIFAILLLYAITYLAFHTFADRRAALLAVWAGCGLYIAIAEGRLPSYYWETILCYPAGMVFATQRARLEAWLQPLLRYLLVGGVSAVAFAASWLACAKTTGALHFALYAVAGMVFAWLFTWLAVKITIANRALAYVGGAAMFALYILQRLPMNLGRGLAGQPLVYFAVVLVVTLVLGWVFDQVVDRTLRRLTHKEATR